MGLFGFGKNKRMKRFDEAVQLYERGKYEQAFDIFEQLTREDVVEARYYCGLICENQTPPNLADGAYWYLSAINHGYENAREAYECIMQKIEKTDSFLAGAIYHHEGDNKRTLECFLKAASQDHAQAQFECAVMYYYGRGTAQDIDKAMYWFEKSATLGYKHAIYHCAKIYEEGKEIPQNLVKSLYWYEKLAQQGDSNSQYKCAKMYKSGQGVPQNLSKVLYWYEKIAECDEDDEVQYECGHMYEQGIGTNKDIVKALYWYEKVAQKGNCEAISEMELGSYQRDDFFCAGGMAYQKEEYECAYSLFDRAADLGDVQAQFICGYMCLTGQGTETDNRLAYYWLNKAREQGSPEAKELLDILQK